MERFKILLICLFSCLLVVALVGCEKEIGEPEFSQLGTICELATLKCYYHNVAEYEHGVDSFLGLQRKIMWIEYGGIVKIGIDASKVSLSKPDQDGLIKVTIPKAEVLDVDFDEDSIYELSETGVLASVSTKDKLDSFAFAQDDMKKTAKENESMLLQGQERAKKVIEGYIQKVGAMFDKAYRVEWVSIE